MHFNIFFKTCYKIFFIWLLLQFFLYNVVTYAVGISSETTQLIWLWKEILLMIMMATTVVLIISKLSRKRIAPTREIFGLKALFALTVIVTIGLNLLIHELPRSVYALWFKYDLLGFLILFIWFHSSAFLDQTERKEMISRYGWVLKIVLVLSLLRYLVVFIKPGTLKLFWYNNFIYEWSVWWESPAVYYTHINQWLPRSQFLFERPISLWFYLVALRPFFFMYYLRGKKIAHTRWRRVIYALNIILTFSRAARWAWVIELVLIWVVTKSNIQQLKKYALTTLLPLFLVIWLVWYQRYYDIFARTYSNTWHIAMVMKWIELVWEEPIFGHGAASAGPGSHRNGEWYNPENQFLQILIEFWLVWFLPRMLLYGYLNLIGILKRRRYRSTSESSQESSWSVSPTDLLLWLSLGMIWLSASGMLLHSFTDRMIVYPFMLLFGIVLYTTYFENREWEVVGLTWRDE